MRRLKMTTVAVATVAVLLATAFTSRARAQQAPSAPVAPQSYSDALTNHVKEAAGKYVGDCVVELGRWQTNAQFLSSQVTGQTDQIKTGTEQLAAKQRELDDTGRSLGTVTKQLDDAKLEVDSLKRQLSDTELELGAARKELETKLKETAEPRP